MTLAIRHSLPDLDFLQGFTFHLRINLSFRRLHVELEIVTAFIVAVVTLLSSAMQVR